MIDREINLLPPQVIVTRTTRIYLDRSGHLLRFIVFLAGLLLILLGAVYLVVWRTQLSGVADGMHEDERQRATLQQVRTINEHVAAIKTWQAENPAWTTRLPAVLAVMPADVVVGRIKVSADPRALELTGTFGKRESLVAFQRQLETLPWVARVESPLSNFATGSEARFSLLLHPRP